MSQTNIAGAIREFMALNDALDDAYWEASEIAHKDMLYDIISIFHQEIAELNKLSIQDHHYPYEIITESIGRVSGKIHRLQENLMDVSQRTRTQIDLKDILNNVLSILDQQQAEISDF